MKDKVMVVQEMQDYIEEHLMERVTLCDLADSGTESSLSALKIS